MNLPVLDASGRTTHVLHRTEDVTDYIAGHDRLRRRALDVEADLGARTRELQAANQRLREVALTLQRSMLPPVPSRPLTGLDVAVRYRPAEDALQVGGDWYDVAVLDAHAVALAVGDVVGKGLPAAAVMGQLRSALSAATLGADGPPEAVDTLDRYAATIPGAVGTTVAQVRFDAARATLRWSRAGHVPPLVVAPDGTTAFLLEPGSPPLGLWRPGRSRPEAEAPFPPGATLLLYTDGLVERRDRSLDEGFARLAEAAKDHAGLEVEALADALLDTLLGDGGGTDDTALVVARSVPS